MLVIDAGDEQEVRVVEPFEVKGERTAPYEDCFSLRTLELAKVCCDLNVDEACKPYCLFCNILGAYVYTLTGLNGIELVLNAVTLAFGRQYCFAFSKRNTLTRSLNGTDRLEVFLRVVL